jgi:predicted N-acetyltransferase YhbS
LLNRKVGLVGNFWGGWIERQKFRAGETMSLVLRPGTPVDAAVCGPICFEAFEAIDDEHNFPWDFPSAEVATELLTMMLSNPGFYSVVAESEGNVVGSNFLDERGPIAGVGPITVDPASQNQTIGRRLMGAVLDRARERHAAGVRLLQSAFHNRSLCLYTKLGFETRETISKVNGSPLDLKFPGYDVRPARATDLAACNALCQRGGGSASKNAITLLRRSCFLTRPSRPHRCHEPGKRSSRYPDRSWQSACGRLPDVISKQRSPYGDSPPGAGSVHHIKPRPCLKHLYVSFRQLRTNRSSRLCARIAISGHQPVIISITLGHKQAGLPDQRPSFLRRVAPRMLE